MAYARLTGAASLAIGVVLALLVPRAPGTESAVLIGWVAVAALAVGLAAGTRMAIVVAAAIFVVRIAMVSVAIGGVVLPIWAHVALLVVTFELAAISIEARSHATSVWRSLSQALISAAVATLVALVMESAVYGSAPGGLVLRVAAIAAVVVLVTWIVTRWAGAIEG